MIADHCRIGYTGVPDWILYTGVFQGIQALALLWLGHTLWVRVARCIRSRVLALVCGLCLLAAAVLVVHQGIHLNRCDIGNPLTFYPYALLVFAGAYLVAQGIGSVPVIEYFGRESLSLFCTHFIVIRLLESAGLSSPWLLYPLAVAASTALCFLLSRIPLLRRIHVV